MQKPDEDFLDFELKFHTPKVWAEQVTAQMNEFLLDHAACERKASGMALSIVAHYPDKPELVQAMIDLAIEELNHFRSVTQLLHERGIFAKKDTKDAYVNALQKLMEHGQSAYFRDRLILASIIEKRGHERFHLVSEALPKGKLQKFYRAISQSEARHYLLFLSLAKRYFDAEDILLRLNELLDAEAMIIADLPFRPALH